MHSIKRFTLLSLLTITLSACSGADLSHNWGSVKDSLFSVGSIFKPTKARDVKPRKPDIDSSKDGQNALLECPRIEYIEELSIVDKYVDNADPHVDALEYSANIAHFESSCRVLPDESSADVEVYIRFYSELGAAGRIKPSDKVSITHPYFIATLNKDNEIINKKVETLSIDFGGNEGEVTKLETLQYKMPYDPAHNPKDYRVVMGFILTKAQIENNRRDYQF